MPGGSQGIKGREQSVALPSPSGPPPPAPLQPGPHTGYSLSTQRAIATLHCKFILYVKLFPWTLALVHSPYSTVSGNPELPLTLFAIWNCVFVNFPNYFTVDCPRQGLLWLPLAQLLGLGPAREEGPERCLLMNDMICPRQSWW